jgi:CRP-like cAMP-binding protein
MNPNEKLELLKQTILFSALSDEELAKLAVLTVERHFSSSETVLWEGNPPEWFYIVAQGRVKVVKYTSAGKELIVAIFTPGHTFGEVAVFQEKPYPASALAIGKTTVLGIKRADILAFLSHNPSVALKMINLLGARLRDSHDRLKDLAGERVEQRIANMLLMLSSRIGLTIPFTRQEIADMTGTATETVIRTTTKLKEQGIINTTRGEIVILDEAKLRLVSDGSPLV